MGLGFRAEGLGFRIEGLGFRVYGLGLSGISGWSLLAASVQGCGVEMDLHVGSTAIEAPNYAKLGLLTSPRTSPVRWDTYIASGPKLSPQSPLKAKSPRTPEPKV